MDAICLELINFYLSIDNTGLFLSWLLPSLVLCVRYLNVRATRHAEFPLMIFLNICIWLRKNLAYLQRGG